ncbi:MAG: hypothetical protein LBR44_08490 [Clostridiales Family XIII bacterium]|jgi:hypothetical protein|nr:hypothetical protein [Clostridiales Family XIII bacterium]
MEALGPQVDLFAPFFIYSVIVTFVVWAFLNFVIGKFVMYSGPEDNEPWDEDSHFKIHPDPQ